MDLGLVRRIDAGAGATLYDARTEPHQHTVCRRCGRVDDLDGELDTGRARAGLGAGRLQRAGRGGRHLRAVRGLRRRGCRGLTLSRRCRHLTLSRPVAVSAAQGAQEAATARERWRSGLIRTTFQASPTFCIPAMITPEGSTSHQRRPW